MISWIVVASAALIGVIGVVGYLLWRKETQMILLNPQRFSASQIIVDGADFDAVNDYMTRGADLTGSADSKQGTLSVWLRWDGADGVTGRILMWGTGTSTARIFRSGTENNFQMFMTGTVSGNALAWGSAVGSVPAGAGWKHCIASWDLTDVAKRHLYINDVATAEVPTVYDDETIDYTTTAFAVGAGTAGADKFNGALSEVWFTTTYIDLSIEENRRKFISSNGKPVDLAADGSRPTGTSPLLYLHLDDAETVANFATNRGTGGNLTITGALDTASTSPSD